MPIEVILRSLKEVQMFLLESTEENRELKEVKIIDHALTKLSDMGGFYTKSLEKWNGRSVTDWRKWETFRIVMVGEYECMLAEGAGTKMYQEDYGMAFHAKEALGYGE